MLLYEAYFPVIVPNGRTTLLGREGWEFESLLPDLEMYGLRVGIELIAYFNTSSSILEFPKRQLDVGS